MTLLDAVHAVQRGCSVKSTVSGRVYGPDELNPIINIGEHAVSFRTAGMMERERRGTFEVYINDGSDGIDGTQK